MQIFTIKKDSVRAILLKLGWLFERNNGNYTVIAKPFLRTGDNRHKLDVCDSCRQIIDMQVLHIYV